jgi:hypothetical protein
MARWPNMKKGFPGAKPLFDAVQQITRGGRRS